MRNSKQRVYIKFTMWIVWMFLSIHSHMGYYNILSSIQRKIQRFECKTFMYVWPDEPMLQWILCCASNKINSFRNYVYVNGERFSSSLLGFRVRRVFLLVRGFVPSNIFVWLNVSTFFFMNFVFHYYRISSKKI